MLLLHHAEAQLRAFIQRGEEQRAIDLFYRVVHERTAAMHQRAQTAESHARKAFDDRGVTA